MAQAEREAELKAKQAARWEKQAEERKKRQAEREERTRKNRSDASKSPAKKPLYLQMEEQYKQKEAADEARRREVLKQQRQAVEPIDFAKEKRDAEEKLKRAHAERAAKKEEKKQAAAAREGGAGSPLPPVRMFKGKTHARIIQEVKDEVQQKDIVRRKAQMRREASLRYAKLVSELVNTNDGGGGGGDATGGGPGTNPAGDRFSGFDSASPGLSRAGLTPALKGSAAGGLGGGGGAGGGGAGGDASRTPSGPPDMKSLSSRASLLNKQVRQKEQQVASIRAGLTPDPLTPPPDALMDTTSELSTLYIDAIKAKLDLFESLSQTQFSHEK